MYRVSQAEHSLYEKVHILWNQGFPYPEEPRDTLPRSAAARLVQPGDLVIIVAYATMSEEEAKSWKPTVIHVNAKNEIV